MQALIPPVPGTILAQFRNIGLAHLSGHRQREHAILAGGRQLRQMRFYAGLDPAFAGLNAGAQCLDIAGAVCPPVPLRQNLTTAALLI